mmetsp:Transcript_18793/g.52371  ORF Transcript_18793/g.52371 Transcript_18793/m.52371 type:complete len:331 (+) Transcript_18793:1011-2003(+)
MVLLDLSHGCHPSCLHKPMRWHALKGDLGHGPEGAKAAACHIKEFRVLSGRQLHRPLPGRHNLHCHHLLVNRRDGSPCAVSANLCETPNLLLPDGCVVLERQAVRPKGLHNVLDTGSSLHPDLPCGLIHVEHFVKKAQADHALLTEGETVWRQGGPHGPELAALLLCSCYNLLQFLHSLRLVELLWRDLVGAAPVYDVGTAKVISTAVGRGNSALSVCSIAQARRCEGRCCILQAASASPALMGLRCAGGMCRRRCRGCLGLGHRGAGQVPQLAPGQQQPCSALVGASGSAGSQLPGRRAPEERPQRHHAEADVQKSPAGKDGCAGARLV